MVSALDSGSSGPGSSHGRGTALCSWARHLTLTVSIFISQVYKWVSANLLLGEPCNGLASHPGGVDSLLAASCYRNWDKLRH